MAKGSDPHYLLMAVHLEDAGVRQVQQHLTAFRYHHSVTKELKDTGALLKDKLTPPARSLLEFLADLAESGDMTSSVNWLSKETYLKNGGPHLGGSGSTSKFRHFQLRLLLERHKGRRPWGENVDLVIDRWSMSESQRKDLEAYLRQNWNLRPIGAITFVDSVYVDLVQVADIFGRLARRVVKGEADPEQLELSNRLFDMHEVRKGFF